jgi:hypothetical protein
MKALNRDSAALATTETVIASLRNLQDRDPLIEDLVAAIEEDRARLLAAVIGAQATQREPAALRLH